MGNKQKRIQELESINSELAKEILLNESAVFEVEKEILEIDPDLKEHPEIKKQVNNLRMLIESIRNKSEIYKHEIFQNEPEIKRLKKN
jgi:hypothetical protein